MYQIEFSRRIKKDLKQLDKTVVKRIETVIQTLAINPRPDGVAPIKGYLGYLRIRVGDYRIVYTIKDEVLVIVIIAVGHRRNIYKSLASQ